MSSPLPPSPGDAREPNSGEIPRSSGSAPPGNTVSTQRRLQQAIGQIVRTGAIEIDVVSGALSWTDGLPSVLGINLEWAARIQDAMPILPAQTRRRLLRAYVLLRDRGVEFDVEMQVVPPGREPRMLRFRSRGFSGEVGDRRFVVVVQDRAAMSSGRGGKTLQSRRFRQAMQLARIGTWTLDLITDELTWSDETFHIHDMKPGRMPTVEEAIAFYPKAAAEEVSAGLAGLLSHGELYTSEVPLTTANGRLIWVKTIGDVDFNAEGVPIRLFGVIQDITDQRTREDEVRRNQERLLHALDGAKDGVWDWNPSASAVHYSPRWKGMLGFNDPEISPDVEEWTSRIHPDDAERVQGGLASCVSGTQDSFRSEYRMKHKDGRWRWVLARGKVVDRCGDGSATRVVGTHTDITEQVELREELVRAREGAESAAKAKSEFLATMSHEVRTPLNGILGMAQILLDSSLDADQKHLTRTIFNSGSSLLHVLDDVLDLSKLEAGKVNLVCVPFDPVSCAREVVDLMQFESRRSESVVVKLEVGQGVPAGIKGDPDRLRQILLNLSCNAVKFTSEGSVTVAIDCERSTAGMRMRFAVRDTGIGIDAAQSEYLFDAFRQADSSTTRRFGGTGLGLAICRSLVELMGGTIGCSGKRGVGATFWINFPADECDPDTTHSVDQVPSALPRGERAPTPSTLADPMPAAAKAHAAPQGGADEQAVEVGQGRLRILVAEDTPVNQMVAQRMLSRLECDVVIAENGEQALELAKEESFDLILMDCQMPVMDGYVATFEIRRHEARTDEHRIPIVAMTANAMKGDRERCLDAGMDGYIAKPVMLETLSALVESIRTTGSAQVPGIG